jgi:hypothetical protein
MLAAPLGLSTVIGLMKSVYDGSRHSMVAPASIAERQRRQYQEQQNRGESA